MHFVHAADIPMEERRPHINRYLAQVRRALTDPSLTQRERDRLRARLDRLVEQVRAYGEATA